MRDDSIILGWEEWCQFPKLGLPAIKAKVDTGAKTSCLHAFNIDLVYKDSIACVQFAVYPLQKNKKIVKRCSAQVVDHRYVTNSGGQREKRYVIKTPMQVGTICLDVEITLSKRDSMTFRMLLGREAIRRANLIVDPARSCLQGKLAAKHVKTLYQ